MYFLAGSVLFGFIPLINYYVFSAMIAIGQTGETKVMGRTDIWRTEGKTVLRLLGKGGNVGDQYFLFLAHAETAA